MEKKKNTPKLRFPEFTGEWEEKKLGEIAEIIMGQSPIGESYNTDGVGTPLINGPAEFTEKYPVKIKWTTEAKKYCQKNDILFCVRGSTTGRMNISNDNYCIGRGVAAIREKSNNKTSFIEFILSKNINALLSLTSGSTFQNIDSKTLNDFPLFHTIIEEQTKIATFLTAVDEKLTQLKKKKTLLEQYKKGVMQKLFSQELRFKDDNNQDFPDWQELPLDKTADIVGGGTPDTSNELLWNGNIQWFTPTELKFKYVKFSNRNITDEGLKQSSAKLLPVGTVLFSSRATIGDASITLKECATNQGFQSFVVGDNLYNEYLYYWIINNKNVFLMKASGSTFLEISKNEVAKINIELPSLPEQQKIANFLSAIDEKISHCGKQIEKMEAWKKGLLQQIFC